MTSLAFARAARLHLASLSERRALSAEAVRAGLDPAEIDALRQALGLSAGAVEPLLSASARTLQRRRARGEKLTPAESDRVWRLLHVTALACDALGTEAAAREWLTTPKTLLGGETPLERLDTEPGLREVEDMLTVIDETSAA